MTSAFSKYFLSETYPASRCVELVKNFITSDAQIRTAPTSELDSGSPENLITSDFQQNILNLTFHHPLALKHPPSIGYQRAVMKELMKFLEEYNVEVIEEIFTAYLDLINKSTDEETFSFRTYLLDECGKTSVTLRESKALVVSGTTGLQTWEAAKHLAEWICADGSFVRNKKILELGCGIGLTGLTICCLCQPQKYVFTDAHPVVLDVLQKNIDLNKSNVNEITETEIRELDWESILDSVPSENFDVVLAADVVFDPALFSGLARVLAQLLCRNGGCEAVLACTVRNSDTLNTFLSLLDQLQLKVKELVSRSTKMFFYIKAEVRLYSVKEKSCT